MCECFHVEINISEKIMMHGVRVDSTNGEKNMMRGVRADITSGEKNMMRGNMEVLRRWCIYIYMGNRKID